MNSKTKQEEQIAEQVAINESISKKRYDLKLEKAKSISIEYTKRLDVFVKSFFSGVTDDKTANEERYHTFDKEWKKMAQKANSCQKVLPVNVFAFQESIQHTIRVQKLMELEPELTQETALDLPVENVIKLLSVDDTDRKRMLEMMLPKPTEENTTMSVVK